MDWNVKWCRIGNNIIKITEISVLQMFVKGYPINIYNSTSVIINCVSFFVYISWATIRVVLFWQCLLQIKATKEFEIEGPDEKKITEFFPCLLHTNGKCVLSLYCLYTFHYAIKYTCAAWPENDKDPAFFRYSKFPLETRTQWRQKLPIYLNLGLTFSPAEICLVAQNLHMMYLQE